MADAKTHEGASVCGWTSPDPGATGRRIMSLKGKVALVTGAGSGIGAAIAVRLAAEGAKVAINFHPGGRHDGADVQCQIEKAGGSAVRIGADVDKRADVEKLTREIVQNFGRIDIAVS